MTTLLCRLFQPRSVMVVKTFCSKTGVELEKPVIPSKSKKLPKITKPKIISKVDLALENEAKIMPTSLSVHDIREDVRQLAENYTTMQGVQWTRFPRLNNILKGHRKGELTVLTGPTGSGKTTFLSEYSLDLASSGVKTLWGSFEIDNRRLILTMLNQLAELRLEKHLHLFEQTYDEFEKLPIRFMNFHGQKTLELTLSNVIKSMSSTVAEYDTSHIIIDNLQFMMGHDVNYKNVNRFEFQDLIIHKFRKFASDHCCHVTVVIHPRKENTEELTNNSIFGGAKATQEADNVMILQVKYSGNGFKYKKYLQITKNRVAGDLGAVHLNYDKEKNGFGQRPTSNHEVNVVIYAVTIFFVCGWLFVWTMHLMAILNAKLKLHKKVSELSPETPFPGVSILKPLVGIDPNLLSNLESFFLLKYPKYQLLFCVNDDQDASLMVVRKLMERYPKVEAKIFTGGAKVGVNPKINNMQPGYEAAEYELLLISDSGIQMKEDTLLDMVSLMKSDVALVHQMPYTCDRKGFPATLEKVYFGTAHARIYLSADLLGINCPTGMSALMRKSVLDEVGGIRAFSQYLAEDFFFAKSFTDRGWKIRISSQPAWQNSATPDVESFQNRMARWAKLRFAMVPHTIILEPLSECMILGMTAGWSLHFLFQVDPFAVYLFHLLLWFFLDYVLLCTIQNGKLPFSKSDFVIAWIYRESSALILFLRALWDPDIKWRTGTYRLKWGGLAQEVCTSSSSSFKSLPQSLPPSLSNDSTTVTSANHNSSLQNTCHSTLSSKIRPKL